MCQKPLAVILEKLNISSKIKLTVDVDQLILPNLIYHLEGAFKLC